MKLSLFRSTLTLVITAALMALSSGLAASGPIPVKVVVVAMYEIGDYTGDAPGEYQFWIEREELNRIYTFPFGPHDLRMNDSGVMGFCTGPGVTNAAMVATALGLDSRFDLRNTYWIVSGIAGVDPADGSVGSAAWADWVVEGDLSKAIDSREMPDDWPYGIMPTNSKRPNQLGDGFTYNHMAFRLNSTLVDWAYELTKDVELMEHPETAEFRKLYTGMPNASRPPFVLRGDSLGSNTYWHGGILNRWANDWSKLHTDGQANFVMTNMEDNGTLRALHRLDKIGKVDIDRVLVLRTASNYSAQPPGETADWSLTAPYPARGLTAKEACYRVAAPVVHALVAGWEEYRETIPGSPASPLESIE